MSSDHITAMNMAGQQSLAGSPEGKLLALDVGLARIGVAVCDPLQLRARPLSIVKRTSRKQDFEQLASVVQAEDVQAIICGLPLNMDGSEGDQARTVRKWAMRLAHALRALLGDPIRIIFWDERLSTFAANESANIDDGFASDDAAAAAVILQRYLDRNLTAKPEDFGQIFLPARDDPAESQ